MREQEYQDLLMEMKKQTSYNPDTCTDKAANAYIKELEGGLHFIMVSAWDFLVHEIKSVPPGKYGGEWWKPAVQAAQAAQENAAGVPGRLPAKIEFEWPPTKLVENQATIYAFKVKNTGLGDASDVRIELGGGSIDVKNHHCDHADLDLYPLSLPNNSECLYAVTLTPSRAGDCPVKLTCTYHDVAGHHDVQDVIRFDVSTPQAPQYPVGSMKTQYPGSMKTPRCHICLGSISPELQRSMVTCECGKTFHESCAGRVRECPNCARSAGFYGITPTPSGVQAGWHEPPGGGWLCQEKGRTGVMLAPNKAEAIRWLEAVAAREKAGEVHQDGDRLYLIGLKHEVIAVYLPGVKIPPEGQMKLG